MYFSCILAVGIRIIEYLMKIALVVIGKTDAGYFVEAIKE